MKTKKTVVMVIIAVVFQFALAFGAVFFNQNVLMNFSLWTRIVLMFLIQWLFLLAPVVLMFKNKEKASDIGFSKEKIPLQVLIGIILSIAMCLVFTVVPILLGYKDMVSSTRHTEVWQFVFEFFYLIFGVALVEEIFFRGFLFKKLLEIKNSKWFAITVSSAIFGLFHIFQGNIIQIFITAILGLIFCFFIVDYSTRKL